MKKIMLAAMMMLVMISSAFGALTDGLFSYVKFENSTLVDEFGYANEWGTLYNPLFVPGKLGNAVNIQTNYEQVVYGGPEAIGADDIYETQLKHNGGTWNIWFNVREFAGLPDNAARIMGGTQEDWGGCNVQADGINMYLAPIDQQPNARLYLWLPDYTAPQTYSPSTSALLNPTTVFQVDTWYMATLTYDEVSHIAKLYINGVEVDSDLFTPSEFGKDVYCSWAFGNGPNNGYWEGGNNYAFPGMIDAFKVWDRPLSGVEVSELYSFENAGLDTPYIPPCTPDWSCSGYSDVCELRQAKCISVVDLNECGETYSGDYTEFAKQDCVREDSKNDNAGFFAQQNVKQQAETPQSFNLFSAISQIITNIRRALGLE